MSQQPPVSVRSLPRLLAVLAVVILPHVRNLPIWIPAFALAMMLWRLGVARRGWRMPGTLVRAGLAALAFASVLASFGSINGQTPGAALLVLMVALKLTETRSLRDYTVLTFLGYFLLGTHFLFDQSIPMIGFLLVCGVLLTAVLVDINHPDGGLPPRTSLKTGGLLVAQALPLMLIFFVLFPRIPGPLWGLPADSGSNAVTGLSERMSPGDISQLSQSDEVAFRVRFEDRIPPRPDRYWRGPVLWSFDGRAWEPGYSPNRQQAGTVANAERLLRYDVTLEAHRHHWLLALDVPMSLPADARLTSSRQLISRKPVRERRLYTVESALDYRLDPTLGDWARRIALSLPGTGNPRTRALAQRWRDDGLDDAELVNRALRMFREQPFVYTMQPPALGENSVDEFLFSTRRGFCEHYASAFAVLMRAAGVPARIVTGYQGGEMSANDQYMIVRQSDAHAWTEVWLPGQGWQRVDPTATVAPDRVEVGLGAALPEGEPVPFLARGTASLLSALRLQWDAINTQWNYWVLAYGPELQQSVLSRIGLPDWRSMILALTGLVSLLLTALGLWLLWQSRSAAPVDPARQIWNRATRRLQRLGIGPAPAEGPSDYADRVREQAPDLAPAVDALVQAYVATRYAGRAELTRLQAAERALPRRRR